MFHSTIESVCIVDPQTAGERSLFICSSFGPKIYLNPSVTSQNTGTDGGVKWGMREKNDNLIKKAVMP